MNLSRITWLKNFTNSVGFSDHSLVVRDKVAAAKAAIYIGASIVERHFTISEASETKDGPVSITKSDLASIIDFSKLTKSDQLLHLNEIYPDWKVMLGSSDRMLSPEELPIVITIVDALLHHVVVVNLVPLVVMNWEETSL